MIDGRIRPDLDGCTDVDLGWSPITNVIPMRRLGVRVGDSVELLAAWVRFPELDVVANRQRYTRVTENRYESGPYDFEMGQGRIGTEMHVKHRGDDIWPGQTVCDVLPLMCLAAVCPLLGRREFPAQTVRAIA